MKKAFLSILLLLAFVSVSYGQNLIGIPKSETVEYIRNELKGFNLDKNSKNESFNYLKFINSAGTKTLIVFFSDEDLSTHTRMVCDYSEWDFLREDYNKKYKKTGKTGWEYTDAGQEYIITLEEKEWYFVVTTKKK